MANPKGNVKTLKSFVPADGKDRAFDAGIHLKLYKEKKESLRSIANWPDKLRAAIDKLIEDERDRTDSPSQAA